MIVHLCRSSSSSSLSTAKYLAMEQDTLHILVDTLGWGQLFIFELFSSLANLIWKHIFNLHWIFMKMIYVVVNHLFPKLLLRLRTMLTKMVVFLLWSTLVPTHTGYLSRSLLQPSSPWQPRPPCPPPPSSPPRSPGWSLARCPSFWWTLSTDLVLSWWKGAGTCIYSELSPLSTDAGESIQNLLRHASSDSIEHSEY